MKCLTAKSLISFLFFWSSTLSASSIEIQKHEPNASSLAVDAGLWIATYAMESYWVQPAGLRTFATTEFDNNARSKIHGPEVSAEYGPREMRWRNYSDAGITGMVVGSIATSYTSGDDKWGKFGLVSRAFAVNNFATTFLKNAVHRSRPKAALRDDVPQDGDNAKSFPSGHASNAMVAATSIVLMTPDKPFMFHAAIYSLGASIGVARIMADRHFLTDVLVGSAIGVGVTHAVFSGQKMQNANVVAGLTSIGWRFVF